MTWSTGLRQWAGIRKHKTDEEIAAEDKHGETVLYLTPESWRRLRDSGESTRLLEVAEAGGGAAAMAWLDERGLNYTIPKPERNGRT